MHGVGGWLVKVGTWCVVTVQLYTMYFGWMVGGRMDIHLTNLYTLPWYTPIVNPSFIYFWLDLKNEKKTIKYELYQNLRNPSDQYWRLQSPKTEGGRMESTLPPMLCRVKHCNNIKAQTKMLFKNVLYLYCWHPRGRIGIPYCIVLLYY